MSLQGNLTDLPLEDLLQVFTVQRKSGILFVTYNQFQAEICFNKSALHSAMVHNTTVIDSSLCLQGEEAIYALLNWPEGHFHFELESILPTPSNISVSANYLILEYYRRRDERDKLKSRQLAHLKPYLLPDPPVTAQINLDLEQWRLLLQVTGQCSVAQIADRLQQNLETVVGVFEDLEAKGLVKFEMPNPIAVETLPSYKAAWGTGSNGGAYATTPTNSVDATLEISYHYRATEYVGSATAVATWPSGQAQKPVGYGREYPPAFSNPATLPNSTTKMYKALNAPDAVLLPAPTVVQNVEARPTVRRGLLSGIMARIRGL